jgi:hypothetical protein
MQEKVRPNGAVEPAVTEADIYQTWEPLICRPREALRSRPRRRRRPRILPRGVMEYWSIGVLRQLGIAPRVRGVGSAFRADSRYELNPGLKPRAESLNPFGINFETFSNPASARKRQ